MSGIAITSITGIDGLNKTAITGIDDLAVLGLSCTIFTLGYSPSFDNGEACHNFQIGITIDYDFDPATNYLYNPGGCGAVYAPDGLYSDGVMVYKWDSHVLTWDVIGTC